MFLAQYKNAIIKFNSTMHNEENESMIKINLICFVVIKKMSEGNTNSFTHMGIQVIVCSPIAVRPKFVEINYCI